MNAHLLMRIVFGLLLLTLAGCGGDSTVGHVVPVSGKVIVDGKTLTEGSVAFLPDKEKGNNSSLQAGGKITADGTYVAFTKDVKGVRPGHYKVTVMAQTAASSTEASKAKLLVPEKYTTYKTTTLLIEVVESPAAGAYDLTLK
jgi:hypothetical protein